MGLVDKIQDFMAAYKRYEPRGNSFRSCSQKPLFSTEEEPWSQVNPVVVASAIGVMRPESSRRTAASHLRAQRHCQRYRRTCRTEDFTLLSGTSYTTAVHRATSGCCPGGWLRSVTWRPAVYIG